MLAGPSARPAILSLLAERRFSQAHAKLRELAQQSPRDATIANLEGVVFLVEGQLAEAESAFQHAIALDPRFALALRNLGITFWHEHKMEGARRAFAAALERDPSDRLAHLYWGQIAFADQDCPGAVSSFTRAGGLLSSMPVAKFMDAVCTLRLGRGHDAALLLEQMGTVPRIPPEAIFKLAVEAGSRREYQVARAALKLLPTDYPDPYTRAYDEGLAAYNAGDDAGAVRTLRSLLSRHFARPEVYDLLGNALERQGLTSKQPKLVEEAYEAYRTGIYGDPHYLPNFIDIGRLALSLGNYELCEQLLTQGLEQNPQAQQLFLERGVAYALSSKSAEAASDFEAALTLTPYDSMPYLTSAMLAIQEGRNRDAVKVLQDGIDRAHPPNAWMYFLLARSLYKTGVDAPETEARIRASLKEAMRLDPTLTEAFALAGHVWLKAGDVEQAIRFFETAHRLEPDNSHYVYALAMARRTRGDAQGAAKEFQTFRDLEAANNPARTREFFMKIFANPASDIALHDTTNTK